MERKLIVGKRPQLYDVTVSVFADNYAEAEAKVRAAFNSQLENEKPHLPTGGIAGYILERLQAGTDDTNIMRGIHKKFPKSKATKKTVAYYRRRLERES